MDPTAKCVSTASPAAISPAYADFMRKPPFRWYLALIEKCCGWARSPGSGPLQSAHRPRRPLNKDRKAGASMADAAPDTPQMVADALACCVARWREEGACRRGGRYDILVYGHTMRAVAVSESGGDADSRAASYLGPDIGMAAAVIVPEGWGMVSADVSYAVHRVSPRGRRRFPDRGFIRGSVCDLAHMVQALPRPPDGRTGQTTGWPHWWGAQPTAYQKIPFRRRADPPDSTAA